jgi:hypothetical protein
VAARAAVDPSALADAGASPTAAGLAGGAMVGDGRT